MCEDVGCTRLRASRLETALESNTQVEVRVYVISLTYEGVVCKVSYVMVAYTTSGEVQSGGAVNDS